MKDHRGRPRVVVTGMGLVTALGRDLPSTWAGLMEGRSGIRPITRFNTTGMRSRIGGCVDFPGDVPGRPLTVAQRLVALGELALDEAVAMAGLAKPFPGPLSLGLPPTELEWPARAGIMLRAQGTTNRDLAIASTGMPEVHRVQQVVEPVRHFAARYGTRGFPQAVTTACASGASAIQMAVEAIRRGETDCVLSGGCEASMTPETMIRFSLLQALSARNDPPETASRPFSLTRDGFIMGDGAAGLVLESMEHATARGATILGEILGVGERADTFHRTRSSPDGLAISGAVENALRDAGLDADAIGYINAHGTSTPENDKMEAMAMHLVFGEICPPISSTKSMLGHTLSAAGAIEAVICLLALRHQMLPPTINQTDTDMALGVDVVPNMARPHGFSAALSNSFGFGGQNVCVVLGRG
ncbi:beta-ketoacyl synthase N-terminal-like domain-containing protein [Rhodovarius sp.]|uniref:beta-ketoacyl synthase N-terminal-like domain-containing protein n=1 Tax=Rhodovarius sp. TaxID=2972673 RepID=UPI0034A103A3